LAKIIATKRPFNENIIREITANIVMALEDLRYWGIIHRDLKPENLIIN
jgi:serine/threonine protein kinase